MIDCSIDQVIQNTFTAERSNFNSGVTHRLLDLLSKLCKNDCNNEETEYSILSKYGH